MPHDFTPFQTVYSFYRRAKEKNLWEQILKKLVEEKREKEGMMEIKKSMIRKFCADSEKIRAHEWKKLRWIWVVEQTFSWLKSSIRLGRDD